MPVRASILVVLSYTLIALLGVAFSSGEERPQGKRIELLASEWKRDPSNLRLGLLLGGMLRSEGREAEAEAVVEKSIDLVKERAANEGDFGESEYLLGMGSLFLGQNYIALQRFQSALSLDPEREEIHLGLIRTQLSLGKEDEALQALDLAKALFPESEAIKSQLAELYERSGRYEEAVPYLEELRFLYPENRSIANRLLNALFESHRNEEARALLEALAEEGAIEPFFAKLQEFRLLLSEEDLRGARVALQAAYNINAEDPRLSGAFRDYYGLQAKEAEDSGNYRRALIFWERALENDPGHFPTQYRLALAHASVGDQTKALEIYLPLLESRPSHPEFYADLSETLISTERFEAAARTIRLGRELVSTGADEEAKAKLDAAQRHLDEAMQATAEAP